MLKQNLEVDFVEDQTDTFFSELSYFRFIGADAGKDIIAYYSNVILYYLT